MGVLIGLTANQLQGSELQPGFEQKRGMVWGETGVKLFRPIQLAEVFVY